MDDCIPQKTKSRPSTLVKPIIPLARPEMDYLDALQYIDHTCCHSPGNTTSGKDMIKIPRFDSRTPEGQINFVNLVQKSLVGQNVTTGPPMYKCMKRVLEGDAKAEFLQQVALVGSCKIANFTTVMATMTVHVFPTYCVKSQIVIILKNLSTLFFLAQRVVFQVFFLVYIFVLGHFCYVSTCIVSILTFFTFLTFQCGEESKCFFICFMVLI